MQYRLPCYSQPAGDLLKLRSEDALLIHDSQELAHHVILDNGSDLQIIPVPDMIAMTLVCQVAGCLKESGHLVAAWLQNVRQAGLHEGTSQLIGGCGIQAAGDQPDSVNHTRHFIGMMTLHIL